MSILIHWGLLLLVFMLGVTLGSATKVARMPGRRPRSQARRIEN